MKILQATIKDAGAAQDAGASLQGLAAIEPNLVLVFGSPDYFAPGGGARQLAHLFPGAELIGCSSAGEISMDGVQDGTAVVTAVRFERARICAVSTELANMADSRAAGLRLTGAIAVADLRLVLVFGQGININGSAMVEGMTEALGADIPIFGGLAGDNAAFAQTWTLGKQGVSASAIVAVGIGGADLRVCHGSYGGWKPFGPARKVTRCEGNVLHELDGESALDIYKRYLGEYACDLPASGLLFPLSIVGEDSNSHGLIRTLLGIDEKQGSLILAGEVLQDSYLKLMHGSTDALVDGAAVASTLARAMGGQQTPALAILVSCVGRKLVMGDRVDEEIEAVAAAFGSGTVRAGFYSYGEISPMVPHTACKLHNQTMTIATIAEA